MARVLVVDDEPVVRKVVARVLALSGHEVVEAHDVAGARAAGEPYDVAVVDKNLPDGSGIDLAGELIARVPELPVIILSGYASEAAARAALDAGVFDFLRKPLENLRELPDTITRALSARTGGLTRRPRGAEGGTVVLCDPGARGDALAEAIGRAGRTLVRADDPGAALGGGGVAAVVVSGDRREPALAAIAAARAAAPPVPALVVAARGALEEILLCLRAGATAYLVDVAPDELLRRL